MLTCISCSLLKKKIKALAVTNWKPCVIVVKFVDIFFYHPKQNVEYSTLHALSSAELTFIQSVQGSLLFIHFWCPSLSMLFKLLLTHSEIDVVACFLLGWWSCVLGNSGLVKLNLLVTSIWALLSMQWLVVLCNSLWQKSKQNRGSQEDGVLKWATVNVSGWANVLTRGLVKVCSDFPWRRRVPLLKC